MLSNDNEIDCLWFNSCSLSSYLCIYRCIFILGEFWVVLGSQIRILDDVRSHFGLCFCQDWIWALDKAKVLLERSLFRIYSLLTPFQNSVKIALIVLKVFCWLVARKDRCCLCIQSLHYQNFNCFFYFCTFLKYRRIYCSSHFQFKKDLNNYHW